VAVDVGCGAGHILKHLPNVGKVGKLIQVDSSSEMLKHCLRYKEQAAEQGIESDVLLADEESLPFEENSVDLFISSMSMHWLNRLPSLISQMNRCLKPEGVFLGTILGGETLNELSSSFSMAELERKGGVSPHTSPLTMVSDVGTLLTDAGFKLVTVDTDIVHVNFCNAAHAMETLQCMGDSNAAEGRLRGCGSDTLLAAASAYQHSLVCVL